ncbi:MAG: LD-carboxypeptidase [Gammaproteobacteria bacterium]|nr:LD-carboxypeptidase [Gammaproteobacteria bacterium]
MKIPAPLKPGDKVEIIAPASRCTPEVLSDLQALLTSWQLNCIMSPTIFGDDLLCANTDEMRYTSLKNALQNTEIKAVICARGGYGSMRLIPELNTIAVPNTPKWFVGMSDVTAIHLYLTQRWDWSTVHGSLNIKTQSPESIQSLKSILFGETNAVELLGSPLNSCAEKTGILEGVITGGNLCLVQASIATTWQLNGENKLIFLEEVGERGYRIDRMLEHLRQAGVFKNAKAIILGDFLEGEETNGSSLVEPVLARFAEQCDIPVVRIAGIGHGYINSPLRLGDIYTIIAGSQIIAGSL